MGFENLKSPAHLWALNDSLADKSYIWGSMSSEANMAEFEAISGPPPPDLCHAICWYKHIQSYRKSSLPGVKKALGKYGPANVEGTTESGDIDPSGSEEEEESEEDKRLREELARNESKKAKQPSLVAKSSVLPVMNPWDDETSMAKLEKCVRSIQAEGLVWASSKLDPCVVEDDEVGTDTLEEKITAFDENVQSMVMAAFNKIQNPLWLSALR
uniref:Translation elongation factor EF1B beta/delta subunit guanine nucleotide exchange domain-containing protein n=1 Tax=Capra hircus TaxID=9925 RepID=A0A452EPS9_CAPHI